MYHTIIMYCFLNLSHPLSSVAMVTMWLCGDVFKTLYFLVRHSPLQFSVCGCVQVMVDIAILLQVALYKRTSTN